MFSRFATLACDWRTDWRTVANQYRVNVWQHCGWFQSVCTVYTFKQLTSRRLTSCVHNVHWASAAWRAVITMLVINDVRCWWNINGITPIPPGPARMKYKRRLPDATSKISSQLNSPASGRPQNARFVYIKIIFNVFRWALLCSASCTAHSPS